MTVQSVHYSSSHGRKTQERGRAGGQHRAGLGALRFPKSGFWLHEAPIAQGERVGSPAKLSYPGSMGLCLGRGGGGGSGSPTPCLTLLVHPKKVSSVGDVVS